MFNPLNIISKLIKGTNQKELDRIQKIVKNINLLEKDVEKLNEKEFPKKTNEFIEMIKNGKSLTDILPEAFALIPLLQQFYLMRAVVVDSLNPGFLGLYMGSTLIFLLCVLWAASQRAYHPARWLR